MRCVWPLPPNEGVNRVDAGFLDPQYPQWRLRMGLSPDEHPGIDINLAGTSGNADEGYPVVAILPGKVVHASTHRVWGNIVLLEHPAHIASMYGYSKLYSQYAHLKWIAVSQGDFLLPGEPVGSIGRGDPARPFMAHLHFELRITPLPADHWPVRKDHILANYIDPAKFLRTHANYTHRYSYQTGVVYLPTGTTRVNGDIVVNLDDPGQVRIRLPKI